MKKFTKLTAFGLLLGVIAFWSPLQAEAVPGYDVELVGNGYVAAINNYGDIAANESVVVGGVSVGRSWVALNGQLPVYLPVPAGFVQTSVADLNDNGIAVGSATDANYVYRAFAWFPDGRGGYESFDLAALLGPESTYSNAVAINNNDVILGKTIEPLPGTLLVTAAGFYYSDLQGVVRIDRSFSNQPSDINDANVIVADNRRMDLSTGIIEDLGYPDYPNIAGSHFQAIQYSSINNNGSIIGRGQLATGLDQNGAIARYTDANGWDVLTGPDTYPAAFDINNNEDVIFKLYYGCNNSPIVRFEEDGAYCISSLLIDNSWLLGNTVAKINDSRQIATTAGNTSQGVVGGVVRLTLAGEIPPPSAPENLTATLRPVSRLYPNGTIKVAWTNNNTVPVTIEVERKPGQNGEADFTLLNHLSGNGTDGIFVPLELNTTYTYRARTCGLAGCSGYSNEASAITPSEPADTTPPVVSFVSPNNGDQVSGNVAITVNAVDNVAMSYIQIRFAPIYGNNVICTVYGSETANCSWNTKDLNPGNYTLSAQAVDHLSNYSTTTIAVEVLETITGGNNGGGKGNKGGNGKGRKR